MPAMVEIEITPGWKPSNDDERAALDAAKKAHLKPMDYVTAMENIRLSKGMYRLKPAAPKGTVKVETNLDDMSNQELMMMFLNLGGKTKKRMTREGLLISVRKKLDEIEIVDLDE